MAGGALGLSGSTLKGWSPLDQQGAVVPWAVAARFGGGGLSCLGDIAGVPHCVTSVVLCGLAKSTGSLGLHFSSAS